MKIINGNVNLHKKRLQKIPLMFSGITVAGYFSCSYNKIQRLENSPHRTGLAFYCYNNALISLKGAPSYVAGSFECYNNRLTKLEIPDTEVGGSFDCSYNQLTSLEGAPKIAGHFICRNNAVKFTEEDVRAVCDVKGRIYT